jgi:hypothetical protein
MGVPFRSVLFAPSWRVISPAQLCQFLPENVVPRAFFQTPAPWNDQERYGYVVGPCDTSHLMLVSVRRQGSVWIRSSTAREQVKAGLNSARIATSQKKPETRRSSHERRPRVRCARASREQRARMCRFLFRSSSSPVRGREGLLLAAGRWRGGVPIAGVHEWRVVQVRNTHPALEPRRGPWQDGLAREINAHLGDGWFMRPPAAVSDLGLAVTFVRGCVHVPFTNGHSTSCTTSPLRAGRAQTKMRAAVAWREHYSVPFRII